VLLPMQESETDDSPVAYRAPLRQALIDDNTRHVNVVVCETDYKAIKRGIEHFAAGGTVGPLVGVTRSLPKISRHTSRNRTTRRCWRSEGRGTQHGSSRRETTFLRAALLMLQTGQGPRRALLPGEAGSALGS
jgi:hypothetical protein